MPDQRLDIIRGADTMRIDIFGIQMKAPNGQYDHMDTLMFLPGRHLAIFRDPSGKLPELFGVSGDGSAAGIDRKKKILQAMGKGITPETTPLLISRGLLEFMDEKKPAHDR